MVGKPGGPSSIILNYSNQLNPGVNQKSVVCSIESQGRSRELRKIKKKFKIKKNKVPNSKSMAMGFQTLEVARYVRKKVGQFDLGGAETEVYGEDNYVRFLSIKAISVKNVDTVVPSLQEQ
jgi:hypothetical protein